MELYFPWVHGWISIHAHGWVACGFWNVSGSGIGCIPELSDSGGASLLVYALVTGNERVARQSHINYAFLAADMVGRSAEVLPGIMYFPAHLYVLLLLPPTSQQHF